MHRFSAPPATARLKKWHPSVLCLAALLSAAPFNTFNAAALPAAPSQPGAATPAATAPSGAAMAQLLRGQDVPLTVKAGDLTAEWRQVKLGQRTIALADAVDPTVHDLAQRSGIYYTKGETFTSGGETYMLAYRESPAAARERQGALSENHSASGSAGSLDLSLRLRANAVLSLSLINLHAIGNINDIRAFDPTRDIVRPEDEQLAKSKAANAASMRNLKQISLGLLMYIQDYDEKLPPMRSANSMAQIKAPVTAKAPATVQQLLLPYIKSAEIFAQPLTRALYRPSPVLSQRALAAFDNPAKTISFYEAKPAADGARAVAFLDGHVKRIPEQDWELVQDESDAATRSLVGGITSLRKVHTVTAKVAGDAPPPPPPPEAKPAMTDTESPLPKPESTSKTAGKSLKKAVAVTKDTKTPEKRKVPSRLAPKKTATADAIRPRHKTAKKPAKAGEN